PARWADPVYLGFTRTPGWCIDVCELKVSREDLRREIADPTKADAWWPYSTRFWIVSPSPALTPPDMLPDGWGLMCPKANGRRFRVHRTPAQRQPVVDLALLITLAKKLDTQRVEAVATATKTLTADYEQRLAAVHERYRGGADRIDPVSRRRLDLLADIEAQTGYQIHEWASTYQSRLGPGEFAA